MNWVGEPVVRQRMHWVVTEAIGAAALLFQYTRDPVYSAWCDRWWDYARRFLIDVARGSWRHELDPSNEPTATVWSGKPDGYHADQAALVTGAPLSSRIGNAARAIAAG